MGSWVDAVFNLKWNMDVNQETAFDLVSPDPTVPDTPMPPMPVVEPGPSPPKPNDPIFPPTPADPVPPPMGDPIFPKPQSLHDQ